MKTNKHNLKLVFVVIDGLADRPIRGLQHKTPLGAADTPNMDLLARKGKTGLMYTVGKGIAPESDVGVISILGYDPFKYSTGRGVLEAVGSGMSMRNGHLALRCNFATLGQGSIIIDRRAGRDLTSKEAKAIAQAINKEVKLQTYPASFKFRNTVGHRGVLVVKSEGEALSGRITNTDPAYTRLEELGVVKTGAEMILKKSEPMDKSDGARISAALVNEFVGKSHRILDRHEINRKRVAGGKLKANVILTRDAGHVLPSFFNINEKYGVNFACLADMPVERGISKLAGMHLVDLPPPSRSLKADCLLRVTRLIEILTSFDCFYIHIKGSDEPGHDGNFQLKTEMIATIDKFFFGELLQKTNLEDHIICVSSDHATPCRLKTHSDDPVPVLIAGNQIQGDKVSKFSEQECEKGTLGLLEHGFMLVPMLMDLLRGKD